MLHCQSGEKISIKMNFSEQGESAVNPEETISGNDIHYCSEREKKMTWMHETRIRLFMQMELEACRNELDWMARIHDCLLNSYPKEDFPPMPPPTPSTYVTYLRKTERAKKGILSPLLKMILKENHPLRPARQSPVHPQHPDILCSKL